MMSLKKIGREAHEESNERAVSRRKGGMTEFESEYLQIPTESPEQHAVRELAEHCVDEIDAYEDHRCRYKFHGNGIPISPEEREDCRRYARDVEEDFYWFASQTLPIDHREWRQIVLEATRRKNRMEWERRKSDKSR